MKEKEQTEQNTGRVRHNLDDLPPLPQAPVPSEGVFASDTSELFELTMSEVDYTQSLLGNRWIGRGQIGLLVGPSGIGKSVVVMQMIAAWSCGKEALGIEPSGGPLSILLIQAEDDKNDLIHMAKGVTAGLGLGPREMEIGARNNILLTVYNHNGEEFVAQLDKWLCDHQAAAEKGEKPPIDLIIINPVFAYLGDGEANDTLPVRQLLRHGLLPLAVKHRVGILLVHHTPKGNNRDTSKYGAHDFMYAGHGSAEFTNASRSILSIEPTEEASVFQFIAAKRGAYIGWPQDESSGMYSRFFKHSTNGSLFWQPADVDDIAAALMPAGCREEDVLTIIGKAASPLIQKEIEAELKINGLKNVRDILPKLLRELVAKKQIFIHPKRERANRVLDSYSTSRCTENIPARVLETVPGDGIGRKELIISMRGAFKFVPSEIEKAIQELEMQKKIRAEAGPRKKILLFRV